MEPVVVVLLVIVLLAAVVFLGLRRRPSQDDGMQTFRRHIDALSPESRREVMDRARRNDGRDRPAPGTPTPIPGIVPTSSDRSRRPDDTNRPDRGEGAGPPGADDADGPDDHTAERDD